jgi:seryl-tRNA synthetase
MMHDRSATTSSATKRFAADLKAREVLLELPARGVHVRGQHYERIVAGVDRMLDAWFQPEGAAPLRSPPVLPARYLEQSGAFAVMPHLIAGVTAFAGGEAAQQRICNAREQAREWRHHHGPSELVLAPAACYVVYPLSTGAVPAQGRKFDVIGDCFREEPSSDPFRMRSFRMRELVYIGAAADVLSWRDRWVERGRELFARLGLAGELVAASDPFFGRAGKVLGEHQRAARTKVELVRAVFPDAKPVALGSFNYHRDHFGERFGLRVNDSVAHSACVAFGLDRMALALLASSGYGLESGSPVLGAESHLEG